MKKLTYIEMTKEEFWKLRRFDYGFPSARKGVQWRKKIKDGWLVGSWVRDNRRDPFRIEWHAADLSGEAERILCKAW